jgi:hypothetical protein
VVNNKLKNGGIDSRSIGLAIASVIILWKGFMG